MCSDFEILFSFSYMAELDKFMAGKAQSMPLHAQLEAWKKYKATQEVDLEASIQDVSLMSQDHIPPSGGKLCFA